MPAIPLTLRLGATLAFMALLAALSVIPGRALPGDSSFVIAYVATPPLLQKVLHVLLYGVLTILWAWTLERLEPRRRRMVVAIILVVTFGAVLEWYQTLVPGRFATLFDVGLNAFGALLGAAAGLFLL